MRHIPARLVTRAPHSEPGIPNRPRSDRGTVYCSAAPSHGRTLGRPATAARLRPVAPLSCSSATGPCWRGPLAPQRNTAWSPPGDGLKGIRAPTPIQSPAGTVRWLAPEGGMPPRSAGPDHPTGPVRHRLVHRLAAWRAIVVERCLRLPESPAGGRSSPGTARRPAAAAR
jgi:hypothetical protein